MRAARWLIPLGGTAVLVGLFLLLRPTGETEPRTAPSPTVTGTPVTTPTPEPTATETPTGRDALAAEVEVEEGRVVVEVEGQRLPDPATIEVTQGQRVSLRVEADVTDEVHVHGYELLADLSAGERATITFRADIPGVFEIELERAGQLLALLEVRP
jgi:FtsP/CotA-like multicopper oxidase with cupredoxin domain